MGKLVSTASWFSPVTISCSDAPLSVWYSASTNQIKRHSNHSVILSAECTPQTSTCSRFLCLAQARESQLLRPSCNIEGRLRRLVQSWSPYIYQTRRQFDQRPPNQHPNLRCHQWSRRDYCTPLRYI